MPQVEELNQRKSPKRDILLREDLEYTAQKIFTYTTIGLAAITVYASVTYLVIMQLKK